MNLPPPGSGVRPTQRFTLTQAASESRGGEGFVREAGRNLILALYGSLRSLKMYPTENPVVQSSITELARVAEEMRLTEGDLEIQNGRLEIEDKGSKCGEVESALKAALKRSTKLGKTTDMVAH